VSFSGRSPAAKVGEFAYWTAIAIIFAWGAWLRFRLPLDPIAFPAYLLPALRKLTGADFGYIGADRTIIYPGFVYLLLRAFGDFRAITVTQHLLGLMAGGILLITWHRIRDFIPRAHLSYPIYRCLGLLATAIYMFSREPLRFEMSIQPEGICGFLISINLYFVIQFIACGFLEGRRTATGIYGTAVVFTSILLAFVKPSFSLTAIVALLPLAALFFRRGWLRQKIALAGGAAVSAALLLLPEHFLKRNDGVSECFLPTQLFVIHADLIRDQMAEDLERRANVPYSSDWLRRVHTTLSEEIARSFAVWKGSPRHYRSLGFDPDYLMYSPTSIAAQLHKEFGTNASALCAFYWYYYWRTWLHRPLVVANKILRQLAIFYASKCPAYRSVKSLLLTDEYQRSMTSLHTEPYNFTLRFNNRTTSPISWSSTNATLVSNPKIWMTYPPAVDFMARMELLARGAPIVEQPAYIRRSLGVLAITYRPLMLIALALSAVVFLRRGIRRQLGWLAALVVFAYSYNAANCLEVAIVHSLDNPRYLTVQVFFTILAQFLAILLIIEVLLASREAAKSRRRQ
jgi:hypothetical protein